MSATKDIFNEHMLSDLELYDGVTVYPIDDARFFEGLTAVSFRNASGKAQIAVVHCDGSPRGVFGVRPRVLTVPLANGQTATAGDWVMNGDCLILVEEPTPDGRAFASRWNRGRWVGIGSSILSDYHHATAEEVEKLAPTIDVTNAPAELRDAVLKRRAERAVKPWSFETAPESNIRVILDGRDRRIAAIRPKHVVLYHSHGIDRTLTYAEFAARCKQLNGSPCGTV